LFLAACASSGTSHYDSSRVHHRPDGFVNVYGPAGGKSLSQLRRWQWEAWRNNRPAPPAGGYETIEVLKPDLARLATPTNEPRLTWIGHATLLIQMNGLNVLTDPVFSERVSPFSWAGPKRRVALPARLDQLPRIDLVVISHNHYDHLDKQTVEKLVAQPGGSPKFLVPLGVERLVGKWGVTNVQPMDWWDKTGVAGLDVTFVPAQHWSARGLRDRNETLWGGWVMQAGGRSIYFAGDTGYSRHFLEIGAKFPDIDLALLPIGAYEPRWFMRDQHVNPDEAVQAHLDLNAAHSIGMHWGTFELTDESLDQPPRDLGTAMQKYAVPRNRFVLMKHGQTMELPDLKP
jgi:L-ascorbate metabolism protein UlaG (beta-lactamase superfamily)